MTEPIERIGLDLAHIYRTSEAPREVVYILGNASGDRAHVHVADAWGRRRHAATDVEVYTSNADTALTETLTGRVRRPVTIETVTLLAEVALDPENLELQHTLQQTLDQPVKERNV